MRKGQKCSKETKRKISEAHKGRKGHKHTEEAKRKISLAKKGKKRPPFSDEWKRKLGESNIGSRRSEVTKKKMSKAHKGSKNEMWKGGYAKTGENRILVKMPEHPFARSEGYIFRSHLVMEKVLGRYLKPCEVVHHINGIVDDDRPENLKLFSNNSIHISFHHNL